MGYSPISALKRTAEITTEQINMLVSYFSTMLIGEEGVFKHMMTDLHTSYITSMLSNWTKRNRDMNKCGNGINTSLNNLKVIFFWYHEQQLWLTLWCAYISGIMSEVSIDPMKVVEDAVLEFTDKKDLFLAYMSSMLVGDQGILVCLSNIQKYSNTNAPMWGKR